MGFRNGARTTILLTGCNGLAVISVNCYYLLKFGSIPKAIPMKPVKTQSLWLMIISLVLILSETVGAQQKPNIIYIMADDMGYADLSSFGCREYETPVIDAFVKDGLKFNNAYAAAPVCTPTRVAFMTGQYPARNVVGLREPLTNSPDDVHLGLSTTIPTVSSILKKNGYRTALFGKWHLGTTDESSPMKHGFDHFFGILSGAADHLDHRSVDRRGTMLIKKKSLLFEDARPVTKSGYMTDLITDYATAFIRQEHEKPFFISIQYTTPHWPWQSPDDSEMPDSLSYEESGDAATYAAMIRNLDNNFARLLHAVRDQGLADSTIIIFTSDNGGDRLSNMGPYRGHKIELWEGGIKVPAAVRWPGVIKPGSESEQPVITMDWTATILDVSQSRYSDTLRFDGMSLVSHFINPKQITPRTFYWRTSNRSTANALRHGEWKYLQTSEGEFLFNLFDDPYEKRDLSKTNPAKLQAMKKDFQMLDSEMLERLVLETK